MLSEEAVKKLINKTTTDYRHVLDIGPASYQINGPRALLQAHAITTLCALYAVLEEERPRFTCDDFSKVDT